MSFTDDEISSAYAYYGVELGGAKAKVGFKLEEVVADVLANPPPGRFVSTLPALLLNNPNINLEGLALTPEIAARLGYLLDVTNDALKSLGLDQQHSSLRNRIEKYLTSLSAAPQPTIWIPKERQQTYSVKDLVPSHPHEKKWNVRTTFDLERFKDHIRTYVRHA